MRKLSGALIIVSIVAMTSGNALALWFDHPNSGRCPGSGRPVPNLKYCAYFDAQGHFKRPAKSK
jgi:hypothetical protein